MIILLWFLALIGFLGGALLFLATSFRFGFPRYRSLVRPAGKIERYLVWAAFLAALIGSLSLFLIPLRTEIDCSASPRITVSPEPNIIITVPSACSERGVSFVTINGLQVIPLLTIPIIFAVVPLALLGWFFRSFLFAVFASLLAGQAAVGMSGYGLVFAPIIWSWGGLRRINIF